MCNLFGHQEKVDTNHYHLINAIADKCKTALQRKSNKISIGGSGSPRREFLDAMSAAKFVQKALYEYEKDSVKNKLWILMIIVLSNIMI